MRKISNSPSHRYVQNSTDMPKHSAPFKEDTFGLHQYKHSLEPVTSTHQVHAPNPSTLKVKRKENKSKTVAVNPTSLHPPQTHIIDPQQRGKFPDRSEDRSHSLRKKPGQKRTVTIIRQHQDGREL